MRKIWRTDTNRAMNSPKNASCAREKKKDKRLKKKKKKKKKKENNYKR
jgi:hypothetical protein